MVANLLKIEVDFLNKHIAEYRQLYMGKFVLIKHDKLWGAFSSFQEAAQAGLEQFGSNDNFLIREILGEGQEQTPPVGALYGISSF